MAKKKGGASGWKKGESAGQLDSAAKDAAVDEPAADTVAQVIARRIRAAKKKLLRIGTIEEAMAEGKEINDDQVRTLETRTPVTAILDELTRVEPLVEKALKKEIEIAVANALEEASRTPDEEDKTADVDEEEEEEEESTLASSQAVEAAVTEGAGRLLDLLYISKVFGEGGTGADCEAFLSEGRTIEDIPVNRQQLQKLANLGKSLFDRSAHDGLTHQEALERCKNMALGFLQTPDARVDEETTVAEMMELINQVKSSEFFRSTIIEATPTAQPDPIVADVSAHVEPMVVDAIPQMTPVIQHPPSSASGAVNTGAESNSFGPVQGDPHVEASINCSPAMPLGHLPPQAPTTAGGGPRTFLPFPVPLPKPASSPQTVPSGPNPQSQVRATPPTGFNIQNIPDGVYPAEYSGGNAQQQGMPSAPVVMESLTDSKVNPSVPEMPTEGDVTTTPLGDSFLQGHDASQGKTEEKSSGETHEQSLNPRQATKPSPDHMNELDQRPRGPGRRQRGGGSSQGGSYQYHNGSSGPGTNGGGMYNSGGRGHSGRGNWQGYRGGHGEGRGRGGRGRSGGSHHGNWESGNSHVGRGQAANGYPSRGSGRGHRGGFRGRGSGGGPWRQAPQHSQTAQSGQD